MTHHLLLVFTRGFDSLLGGMISFFGLWETSVCAVIFVVLSSSVPLSPFHFSRAVPCPRDYTGWSRRPRKTHQWYWHWRPKLGHLRILKHSDLISVLIVSVNWQTWNMREGPKFPQAKFMIIIIWNVLVLPKVHNLLWIRQPIMTLCSETIRS